ncbi:AAA family ATPase [Amycolatopsis suaedae]|uniref:ATPase AAA-type core domain-containing protein n=1 Tax=Amycolatopsis suaedae TaxID=2510978 RepID=A0A4Q7J2E9_9PSEU|nr:AAA family ATPase [Amycolatopsis suaedae]RZQ61621.1 hypothetical protein EWH70_21885 [Amycolatopsis suaedae]
MKVLKKVAVFDLIGQFNHVVEFPSSHSFVVLHGPNGVGKTKLLELINATFSGEFFRVLQVPFTSIEFSFADGYRLFVLRSGGQQILPGLDEGETLEERALVFRLRDPEGSVQEWSFDNESLQYGDPRVRRVLERDFGIIYVGRDRWRLKTGELVETSELPMPMPSLYRKSYKGRPSDVIPEWLHSFLSETRVHLIETQRLLQPSRRSNKIPDGEGRHRKDTVSEFAEDLASAIASALARNSRTSQKLDRTFPRRVLRKNPLPSNVTDDLIRERYEEQSRLREELEAISILDNQDDIPLPEGGLENWEKRVLWVYLTDSAEKLATFETLLARVRLLVEIVNSRFLNKKMAVDRERGFVFRTSVGREISAKQLSSGEQHELVLVYDLLFNVPSNSLVLIDEPEISLHIAWQQKFLADIERIAGLAGHRFVIATHSPQIVHKWWDRTVSLGSAVADEVE